MNGLNLLAMLSGTVGNDAIGRIFQGDGAEGADFAAALAEQMGLLASGQEGSLDLNSALQLHWQDAGIAPAQFEDVQGIAALLGNQLPVAGKIDQEIDLEETLASLKEVLAHIDAATAPDQDAVSVLLSKSNKIPAKDNELVENGIFSIAADGAQQNSLVEDLNAFKSSTQIRAKEFSEISTSSYDDKACLFSIPAETASSSQVLADSLKSLSLIDRQEVTTSVVDELRGIESMQAVVSGLEALVNTEDVARREAFAKAVADVRNEIDSMQAVVSGLEALVNTEGVTRREAVAKAVADALSHIESIAQRLNDAEQLSGNSDTNIEINQLQAMVRDFRNRSPRPVSSESVPQEADQDSLAEALRVLQDGLAQIRSVSSSSIDTNPGIGSQRFGHIADSDTEMLNSELNQFLQQLQASINKIAVSSGLDQGAGLQTAKELQDSTRLIDQVEQNVLKTINSAWQNSEFTGKNNDELPVGFQDKIPVDNKANEIKLTENMGKEPVADNDKPSFSTIEKAVNKLAFDMPQLQRQVGDSAKTDVPAMSKPMTHPEWRQELGERIVWMNNRAMPYAELKLNPEHLGPISIRIDIDQDQASINFSAQHASVRDAIEAAIPKLRELLGGQQLNLAEVTVSQSSPTEQNKSSAFGQAAQQQQGEAGRRNARHSALFDENLAAEIGDESDNHPMKLTSGLLNIFA